jgi:hypothetical protein
VLATGKISPPTGAFEARRLEDGSFDVSVSFDLNVFDLYNWDQGKAVTILGVYVPDRILGRLHKVGLACEYPVRGRSMTRTMQFNCRPDSSAGASSEVISSSDERDGTRADARRERH